MLKARVVAEIKYEIILEMNHEEKKQLDIFFAERIKKYTFEECNIYPLGFDIKDKNIQNMKAFWNDLKNSTFPFNKYFVMTFVVMEEKQHETSIYLTIDLISGILCSSLNQKKFMTNTKVGNGILLKR